MLQDAHSTGIVIEGDDATNDASTTPTRVGNYTQLMDKVVVVSTTQNAIKKYGGVDPDSLRKAALEVDIPEGGTMLGFGVKFPGDGAAMAGQNERSFPVVIQYVDDKSYVVWPKSQQQREAVLPLPKGTTYSNQ